MSLFLYCFIFYTLSHHLALHSFPTRRSSDLHTFLAVDLQLIGSTGSTFLWPILALSNIAQGAAAFAIMLATKNERTKGLEGTSGLSDWLGITELAMFGVNLRIRYTFLVNIIGYSISDERKSNHMHFY